MNVYTNGLNSRLRSNVLGHRKAEEHVREEEGSVEGIVEEEEGKVKDGQPDIEEEVLESGLSG